MSLQRSEGGSWQAISPTQRFNNWGGLWPLPQLAEKADWQVRGSLPDATEGTNDATHVFWAASHPEPELWDSGVRADTGSGGTHPFAQGHLNFGTGQGHIPCLPHQFQPVGTCTETV